MNHMADTNNSRLSLMSILLLSFLCHIGCEFTIAMDFDCVIENFGRNIAYHWDPNHLPGGRNPPYLASYKDYYALKTNKYLEAYVHLDQGPDDLLRCDGPMTLTAVFQCTKQWPMQSALISKWGYLPDQASYEFGITPDLKLYFKISQSGLDTNNVVEVISAETIILETPMVVSAVFDPGKRMTIYINGVKSAEVTQSVPRRYYDSDTPVNLLNRFEGLLAGVWFHVHAMSDEQAGRWADSLKAVMPSKAPYHEWKTLNRNVPRSEATYLNTTPGMKLFKEIDIKRYKGSYVCLGDLDNDLRMDFVLYKNGSSYTVPGRITAINQEGQTLWEVGDTSLEKHANSGKADVGQPGSTPALRGICTIFDIDGDGRSEVITELLEDNIPKLCILDGQTGKAKNKINSPIDMSIRQPKKLGHRQPSRSHPVIRIAWLDGKNQKPSIILKYGASNGIDCHAFALNDTLDVLWHIHGTKHSMGHVPTVADVDGDGFDEIVLGHMLVDHTGQVLWDKGVEFTWHADTTAVDKLLGNSEKQILISVCGVGPVYCLDHEGRILWSKKREEIEHGQAVWVGNFIEDIPGKEVIVCASGHVGKFVTLRGNTGETVAVFEHKKLMPAYPDFPTVVNWNSKNVQCLWIPQDRTLVDGRGRIVAELGDCDGTVQSKLHCGTSWRPVGAQAFAVDLLGGDQDELILYEPYEGESIFIFANPASSFKEKPYRSQQNAYNIRTYF